MFNSNFASSTKKLKKILIIRFSSIGDIVLTTPVIRCLKKKFGDKTQIHFLTKKQFTPLLAHNPYLSKIHQISDNTKDVTEDLKKENFDLIIDLHKNLRSNFLKFKLRKRSRSFNKLNIEKWILVNLGFNLLPKRHIVDRYMDTVKPFGVENDLLGLDLFLPPNQLDIIKTLPEEYSKYGYWVLAPGGTYKGKRLHPETVLNICKGTDRNIILIGGFKEKEFGTYLKEHKDLNIIDKCGEVDLLASAALVKNADGVICTDTGFMHIAAAFKKKIISLWGCTTPDFGMYPYLPDPQSVILQPTHLKKKTLFQTWKQM